MHPVCSPVLPSRRTTWASIATALITTAHAVEQCTVIPIDDAIDPPPPVAQDDSGVKNEDAKQDFVRNTKK